MIGIKIRGILWYEQYGRPISNVNATSMAEDLLI